MTNLPTSLPPHVARPHPWLVKNNKRTSQVSRIHGKDRVLVLAGGVSSSLSRTHSDVVSALHSVSWASTNSIHLLRRLGRKTGAFTPFLSSHRPLSSQSCISCTRGAIGSWSSVLSLSLALVAHFPIGPPPCNVVRTRFASLSSRPHACLRSSTKVYPSS